MQFPKQETVDRIKAMPNVNTTATEFIGMTSQEIGKRVADDFHEEGAIIDVSKTSEEEKKALREAINTHGANITLLGDTEEERDENGFTEEDRILRAINEEILVENPSFESIREAFRNFIKTVLSAEKRHLVINEWNKYIVNHPESGIATSAYKTHHPKNVGLKQGLVKTDTLRDLELEFVNEIIEEVKTELAEVFEDNRMLPHRNETMNDPMQKSIAIIRAMYSNFLRGAGFLRYRRGEDYLDGYEPRRLAANIIDETIA